MLGKPVISHTPNTVKELLQYLMKDDPKWLEIGRKSLDFAERSFGSRELALRADEFFLP